MNYLFLLNALILFSLGSFLGYKNRNSLSFRFLIFNFGLALWNICIFLIEERPNSINVDFVARLQLIFSMVLVNGIFYFCISYPFLKNKYNYWLNAVCFLLLCYGLLFTTYVTQASVKNGEVVYVDNALGFLSYAAYLIVLAFISLNALRVSYRQYPDYRERIKYIFFGLALYTFFVMLFNVLLPLTGHYELLILGRLSGIFPALFFAYAITKHDFMDITVVINKNVSWLLVGCIIIMSFALAYFFDTGNDTINFSLVVLLGLFWSLMASPFQNFLLTSARRKFVRSWYDTENVISEISEQLAAAKNRESIFTTIERILDDTFQLEASELVLAIRANESLSHYGVHEKSINGRKKTVLADERIVASYKEEAMPDMLENCPEDAQEYLKAQGFKQGGKCVVIPFYSPECLEGLVILGERSNQELYNQRDMQFFIRLVTYVSAILYRLTPFEKLEKQYFENRQKLHEAEIQLIRAQKIEAIVHATRQCHHEIRTPLNIIRLGIGRIKALDDLEAYKHVANEEISRALEIVEETLTITDVSEAVGDRLTTFDINEALRRSARVIDTTRYELDFSLGKNLMLRGVFSDIQVVATNLIHNALDVMPEGGHFAIRSYASQSDIIIEIEDNGPGIDESLRSKVWEPYFSGQLTEVGNSTAGRGWGLTIVNRIVTEHQGTIRFNSEVGKGTTFIITLPGV